MPKAWEDLRTPSRASAGRHAMITARTDAHPVVSAYFRSRACDCGHHAHFRETSRAAVGFVKPCLRVCKVAPRQTTGVRPLVGLCVHDWCAQVGVFSVHARAWTEWSASLRGFRALGRPAPGVQICLWVRKSSSRPTRVRSTSVTHCEPLNN